MKLLSIAIPCYNSQEYMRHAIETVLVGGDDVEILIIDDGSKDDTAKIANEYAAKYPTIVRSIHQENGGHGEAVNTGLKNATGLYYKVVDSDDWVEEDALKKVLGLLKKMVEDATNLDMLICNYVYEKVSANKQKVIDYRTALPKEKIFSWSEIMHFKTSQNILMHSVIYRTNLLRECGLELPKHTFYVDNIFVYQPLPMVMTMYYLDVDLYRYYIGREDQSVNESVMIGRVDQQIKITKFMIESHDLSKIKNRKLRNYMAKYLAMMMAVCTVLLLKEGSDESFEKKVELWDFLEKQNKRLYHAVKNKTLGRSMQLKGRTGRKIIILGYQLSQKIYGFN
ncbi:MAG: glycosyltransferase family 2 protein [Velocimicrobium sp.]